MIFFEKYPAAILASISTRESGGIRWSIKHVSDTRGVKIRGALTRDVVTFVNGNSGLDDSIIFHIAHRDHVVDLRNT